MSSFTKQIGDIGVAVAIAEFLKYGINVLIPFDDNTPYDLVINNDSAFYKVQVKATASVKYQEYLAFQIMR